jgi:hypothetical protein
MARSSGPSFVASEPQYTEAAMPSDYERTLGVIEAFIAVRDQCPSGAVRSVATRALEAARSREQGVLQQQAYFVLSAIQGWRGERSSQVHRSLRAFLDATDNPST